MFDLGITEVVALEFLVRFSCGCWQRRGTEIGVVFNAHLCPEHAAVKRNTWDGQ